MTQPVPGINAQWAFQFTADSKMSLSFVSTNTASSGVGAGCVNTVAISGTYGITLMNLTVTAQSGTTGYTSCLNSAQNMAPMAFDKATLDMFSADFTGPFTVTKEQLTLGAPGSDLSPGILTRQM